MLRREPSDVRAEFDQAAAAYVEVVEQIPDDAWHEPGLGEWTVRELTGHASRSLVTTEQYLGAAPPPGAPQVPDAVAYYRAVRTASHGDPAAVTQRGRDAAKALGDDPRTAVRTLADRVRALVAATPDDAVTASALAVMPLIDYLPTRTFELTVHTLDLARATGAKRPDVLAAPVAACLLLAAEMVGDLPAAPDALLLLTGRTGIPPIAGI